MAVEADYMRYSLLRDLGRGATFPVTGDVPGGLQDGDRFYHTTYNLACYYSAGIWLTTFEYEQNLTPYARQLQPYAGGATTLLFAPSRTDLDALVTRVKVYLDVATTNNGANYWSFAVKYAGTSVFVFDTSGDAPGAVLTKETATTTAVTLPNIISTLDVTGKTGAPGSVVINGTIWYRLIVG
jgi:hypothetical protein